MPRRGAWHAGSPNKRAGPTPAGRADLNGLYRSEPALHQRDFSPEGFEWIDANDNDNSVLTFLRRGEGGRPMLVACNFTPVPRSGYRVGVAACRGGGHGTPCPITNERVQRAPAERCRLGDLNESDDVVDAA